MLVFINNDNKFFPIRNIFFFRKRRCLGIIQENLSCEICLKPNLNLKQELNSFQVIVWAVEPKDAYPILAHTSSSSRRIVIICRAIVQTVRAFTFRRVRGRTHAEPILRIISIWDWVQTSAWTVSILNVSIITAGAWIRGSIDISAWADATCLVVYTVSTFLRRVVGG